MKIGSLISVLLLIAMVGHSQKLKDISWYFSHYDTASSMNYFKVGNHILGFDSDAVYVDRKAIIKKDTATFFFLEVYLKKILIVSYYPNNQASTATGPQFRPKQKVEFISLADPKQKWLFDLKGAFNSEAIDSFNMLTGELELKRTIKGQKM
ncbi:hypothetical protein D3H65_12065 [Paraflavitalea soli]|uniref:Uncharacterized protein n=1 Tax=Paraflavitalea soli TaxID=2315862 RepID=A0A3B7MWA8_9BACT|nr:hypothetical protein [Paraflavitalea soli]AXY74671.1 hypothetical protein D3H65_12065 [Paraflavitalea soli]